MKEFWNKRYGSDEYAYGEAPNSWLREELPDVPPMKKQRILLPAEGEGRNAVYAAIKGYEVIAFDISEAGREKALQLASKNRLEIEYQVVDACDFEIEEGRYDVVALIYAHFPAAILAGLHQRYVRALREGGHFILEGFAKEQLPMNSGGPKNEEMLFSIDMLRKQLSELKTLDIRRERIQLDEGFYHSGEAEVIRAVGLR